MSNYQKLKIKYDKKNLCKCGKPTPIMPYYCEICKIGSMKELKLEVVNFGKKKLPSGKILK